MSRRSPDWRPTSQWSTPSPITTATSTRSLPTRGLVSYGASTTLARPGEPWTTISMLRRRGISRRGAAPLVVTELVFAKLLSTGKDYVLSGPTSLTRPAGSVLSQNFSVQVPNAAPLGRYRVFGQVMNPDSLDEDFIDAEVVP